MKETLVLEDSEEELKKLRRNNLLIRLYLHYKFYPFQLKIEETDTANSLKKFKTDLFLINESFSSKEAAID